MEHRRPVLTVPKDLSFDVRSRRSSSSNNNGSAWKDEKKSSRSLGDDCDHQENGYGIYLNEDWDSGIGGGLWTTGLALGKYFATSPHFLQQFRLLRLARRVWNTNNCCGATRANGGASTTATDNQPLRVLELGSGNGFLGVCLVTAVAVAAANSGGDADGWPGIEVVVTDTAEHLPLMKKTIDSNLKRILPQILGDQRKRSERHHQSTRRRQQQECDDDDDDESDPLSVSSSPAPPLPSIDTEGIASVREYLWGEDYDFGGGNGSKHFDLIVGSDVAYRDHLHDPLIAALKEFSPPPPGHPTVALLGVTMNDTKPVFFEKLASEGFRYEKLADHLFGAEFSTCSRQFGVFAVTRVR